MKQLLSLIFILFIFSCNQNRPNKKIISEDLLNIKISDDVNIFGIWTMCSTSGNGYTSQINVCPIILFNQNGTGVINNSSIENFSWTLKDKKLHILCVNQNSNCVFPDTNYLVIFHNTQNGTELTINQLKRDYSYHLARQKIL